MRKLYTIILIFFSLTTKADYWTQKANFPGIGKDQPFSFSIGTKGYVGCGRFNYSNLSNNNFWEFDPALNTWTQVVDFGGGNRWGGISFSIGSKGYAGLGVSMSSDLWEYDPVLNTWTQKANFGGGKMQFAAGFSINNKGYAGIGNDSIGNQNNTFWEFDPVLNLWTQKMNLPGIDRQNANGFSIGNKGYIVGGYSSGGVTYQDLWEYDPALNSWTQKANLPSFPRGQGAAFSILCQGFFGLGDTLQGALNDFWQYDPFLNQWTQKANFGGPARDEMAYFSIGMKGYVGLGTNAISLPLFDDWWEYTPDTICITSIEEIPNNNLQFTISPNPASEFIVCSLQFAAEKKIELTITNVEGKKVYQNSLDTRYLPAPISSGILDTKIDISQFSNGIYFVTVDDGKQRAVKKFIKN